MKWLLFLLAACGIPRLEEAGRVDDAGVCQVIVVPAGCDRAAEVVAEIERQVPPGVCVVWACDCELRVHCVAQKGEK